MTGPEGLVVRVAPVRAGTMGAVAAVAATLEVSQALEAAMAATEVVIRVALPEVAVAVDWEVERRATELMAEVPVEAALAMEKVAGAMVRETGAAMVAVEASAAAVGGEAKEAAASTHPHSCTSPPGCNSKGASKQSAMRWGE